MKKIICVASFLLFFAVTNLYAGIIDIDGIIKSTVAGNDMAGMKVTVNFQGGGSETLVWKDLTGNMGGAGNGVWSLSFNGSDTWFSNNLDDILPDPNRKAYWEFYSNRAVDSFTIDAYYDGYVFFDIVDEQNVTNNTPGSFQGWWQENGEGANGNNDWVTDLIDRSGVFMWTFSNPGRLIGQDPKGDLYGTLLIDFLSDQGGQYSADAPFKFGVDTDLVVPEPATMLLMGLGLIGLAGVGAKRRKVKTA